MALYCEMMKFFRNHRLVMSLLTEQEAEDTYWYN